MTQPHKLIEVALPLPEINDASPHDSMRSSPSAAKRIKNSSSCANTAAALKNNPSFPSLRSHDRRSRRIRTSLTSLPHVTWNLKMLSFSTKSLIS